MALKIPKNWHDLDMNWSAPDPLRPEYYLAVLQAYRERAFLLDSYSHGRFREIPLSIEDTEPVMPTLEELREIDWNVRSGYAARGSIYNVDAVLTADLSIPFPSKGMTIQSSAAWLSEMKRLLCSIRYFDIDCTARTRKKYLDIFQSEPLAETVSVTEIPEPDDCQYLLYSEINFDNPGTPGEWFFSADFHGRVGWSRSQTIRCEYPILKPMFPDNRRPEIVKLLAGISVQLRGFRAYADVSEILSGAWERWFPSEFIFFQTGDRYGDSQFEISGWTSDGETILPPNQIDNPPRIKLDDLKEPASDGSFSGSVAVWLKNFRATADFGGEFGYYFGGN